MNKKVTLIDNKNTFTNVQVNKVMISLKWFTLCTWTSHKFKICRL